MQYQLNKSLELKGRVMLIVSKQLERLLSAFVE